MFYMIHLKVKSLHFFYKQLESGPSHFQHSPLTYCILLVKDQNSFYEIRSLANHINIKHLIGLIEHK